jgi:glutathione-regulated potassium-efflux system ancillary protein KefG
MKSINRRNFIGMIGVGTAAMGLEAAVPQGLSLKSIQTDKNMTTMEQNRSKVAILLAHPTFEKSVANRALVDAVQGLPGVTVIDIYAAPFTQDTYRQPLTEASTIVFQFPFYWLSAPSQLKKWCDELFSPDIVKGKNLLVAVTTGSEYEAYRSGGRNRFTIDELLRPYQALAHHAGLAWQTPFAVYGAGLPTAAQSIRAGAVAYKALIESLTA